MAVPLSFTIFIIAWVLQLVVYFGFPYNSASAAGAALTVLFSFFPWTLLSKGMLDLAAATTGDQCCFECSRQAQGSLGTLLCIALLVYLLRNVTQAPANPDIVNLVSAPCDVTAPMRVPPKCASTALLEYQGFPDI